MDPTKGISRFGPERSLVRVGGDLGMAVYDPFGSFYKLEFGPWARRVRAKALRAAMRHRCPWTNFMGQSLGSMAPSEQAWSCALLDLSGVEFYPYVIIRERFLAQCIDIRAPSHVDLYDAEKLLCLLLDDRDRHAPPLELLKSWNWDFEVDRVAVESASGYVGIADLLLMPFPPFEGPIFPTSESAFGASGPCEESRFKRKCLHREAFARRYVRAESKTGSDGMEIQRWRQDEMLNACSFDRPAPTGYLRPYRVVPSCLARFRDAWGRYHRLDGSRGAMRFGPWDNSIRAELERSSSASRDVSDSEPRYGLRRSYVPPPNERFWQCSTLIHDPIETFPIVRFRGRRVHCFPPFYEKRADGSWNVGPGKAKFWVVRYIDEDRWRSDAAYVAELRGLEGEGWRFDLNDPGVVPAFIEGLIAEGDLEFIAGPPPEGPTGLVETD